MYNEDNQDNEAQLMIDAGLPQGRMLYPSNGGRMNAVLETKEDGPFWYGDLSDFDLDRVHDIAKKIGKNISVTTETTTETISI